MSLAAGALPGVARPVAVLFFDVRCSAAFFVRTASVGLRAPHLWGHVCNVFVAQHEPATISMRYSPCPPTHASPFYLLPHLRANGARVRPVRSTQARSAYFPIPLPTTWTSTCHETWLSSLTSPCPRNASSWPNLRPSDAPLPAGFTDRPPNPPTFLRHPLGRPGHPQSRLEHGSQRTHLRHPSRQRVPRRAWHHSRLR